MKSPTLKFKRAKETKFLVLDSIIFDKFSPYALKVYGQLRKLVSYTDECSETQVTIKNLSKLCDMSERKIYDVLNELEFTHFIIQRTNIYHYRRGQLNTFSVSQTYDFFREKTEQSAQESDTPAQNDMGVQNLTTPAQYAEGTAQYAEGTAQNDIIEQQDLSQQVSKKKHNKPPVNPAVTVFSDESSIKCHLNLVVANRKIDIDDDTIEQIIFYIAKERDYDEVIKKINISLKLIRQKKWNIPHGYKGITSKAIREKEEAQQRQKEAQQHEDGKMARKIHAAVLSGAGLAALSEAKKKLGM
jgi:hypothetical protein